MKPESGAQVDRIGSHIKKMGQATRGCRLWIVLTSRPTRRSQPRGLKAKHGVGVVEPRRSSTSKFDSTHD
jgi:hypothetical protein